MSVNICEFSGQICFEWISVMTSILGSYCFGLWTPGLTYFNLLFGFEGELCFAVVLEIYCDMDFGTPLVRVHGLNFSNNHSHPHCALSLAGTPDAQLARTNSVNDLWKGTCWGRTSNVYAADVFYQFVYVMHKMREVFGCWSNILKRWHFVNCFSAAGWICYHVLV